MTAGTLAEVMERRVDRIAEQAVAQINVLRQAAGTRPAFQTSLDQREQAERWLPTWWALGCAEPPVSGPYWEAMIQSKGPAAAMAYDHAMRRLHKDARYTLLATEAMTPELASIYDALRSSGMHLGRTRPMAGQVLKLLRGEPWDEPDDDDEVSDA